jgi:hypothetical protein
MMTRSKDWRLAGNKHLKGALLHRRKYFLWQPDWTHDHCEFCMQAIVVEGDPGAGPNTLTEGWATDDEYYWICDACFQDLRARMRWKTRGVLPSDRPDTPPPTMEQLKADSGYTTKRPPAGSGSSKRRSGADYSP